MRDTATLPETLPAPVEDSLRKRYFYKLAFNLAGLPLSWALQALVPRALGPAQYGNFSFITSFFTTLVNFLDAGTSTKLYNYLCQRPEDRGVLRFYWGFMAKVAVGLVVLVVLGQALGWRHRLWPDQRLLVVGLAAVYSMAVWANGVGARVIDAYGLTIPGERMRLVQKCVALLLVGALFLLGWLTLPRFFAAQLFIIGLLLVLWQGTLRRKGVSFLPAAGSAGLAGQGYGREFWDYSHPLLVGGLVATLEGLTDRWLLQYFGSSVEQGFYALSYQVGALCFVFSGAVVPLLAREFTQAHFAGDTKRMASAFAVQVPRFFALAAFFGAFFASQADTVSVFFGGAQFGGATVPMMLMCLYPVHQTYGQLTASVFFACGRTRLYRNIGIASSCLGVLFTCVALAPRQLGGLQLGSAGLAMKMFGLQALMVNVQLWYCTRQLGLPYGRFLANQGIVLGMLGLGAILARFAVAPLALPLLAILLLAGVLYVLMVLGIVWSWPGPFQLSRETIKAGLARGLGMLGLSAARHG